MTCHGSAAVGHKTVMRGAGELLCGTPRVSTNIDGTAALCRPPMPHTLRSRHSAKSPSAAFEPPRPSGFSRFCGNLALPPSPELRRDKPYTPMLAPYGAPPFGTARMVVLIFIATPLALADLPSIGGPHRRLRCNRRTTRPTFGRPVTPIFLLFAREKKENKKSGRLVNGVLSQSRHIEKNRRKLRYKPSKNQK